MFNGRRNPLNIRILSKKFLVLFEIKDSLSSPFYGILINYFVKSKNGNPFWSRAAAFQSSILTPPLPI
jgi:hypothetical protein